MCVSPAHSWAFHLSSWCWKRMRMAVVQMRVDLLHSILWHRTQPHCSLPIPTAPPPYSRTECSWATLPSDLCSLWHWRYRWMMGMLLTIWQMLAVRVFALILSYTLWIVRSWMILYWLPWMSWWRLCSSALICLSIVVILHTSYCDMFSMWRWTLLKYLQDWWIKIIFLMRPLCQLW